MGTVLFNLLMSLTKSPAYTVTISTTNDNEFEALRPLMVQYGNTKRHTMISMLMRIMLQKFDERKFVESPTHWELGIAEYDRVTAGRIRCSRRRF